MDEKNEVIDERASVIGKSSRQPLFGALLFWGLFLIFGVLIGGVIWGGYLSWNFTKDQAALPSISGLPQGSDESLAPVTRIEAAPIVASEPDTEGESLKKTKGIDIQVLNGGAAKGSAGTVAENLKKDGFTKVTVGNTVNNYTDTVVYYAVGHESEADAVKKSLLKSYPKAETKSALQNNKETTVGTITVILGK